MEREYLYCDAKKTKWNALERLNKFQLVLKNN